jgi:hypothetical protein
MIDRLLKIAAGAALALPLLTGAAVLAPASATIITPGAPGSGEPSLVQVMNSLYGAGNYVQQDNTQYQTFVNTGVNQQIAFADAFASHASQLAVFTNQTTYNALQSVQNGVATPLAPVLTTALQSTAPGGSYTLGFRDLVTGLTFSSDRTQNADGLDHLIVFSLTNRPGTLVLAWEDMIGGDYDYQDAIFTLTALNPQPVPEPASLGLFSLVCLGTALAARRRRPGGRPAAS